MHCTCLFPGLNRTKSYYIGGMVSRRSRGRPLNAPAAFIHPCQPTSPNNRFSMAAFCQARTAFCTVLSYRSELVAKKRADSYPKIICVLIDIHGILLTEYLH